MEIVRGLAGPGAGCEHFAQPLRIVVMAGRGANVIGATDFWRQGLIVEKAGVIEAAGVQETPPLDGAEDDGSLGYLR